jgi:hypothetical protein
MCLPSKSSNTTSSAARSIIGMGALMIVACLAGPLLTGALGALGVGVLVGAGGALFALALCLAVPAVVLRWRHRGSGHQTRIEL